MRDSPSIVIVNKLVEFGAQVNAFDPIAMENAKSIFGDSISYCQDEYEACKGADCLVIVTEWNQFRKLDMERIKSLLREHNLADLRNIYEPTKIKNLGFNYTCVGRPL
jgi:UDPglucose 6-dehydrogenase